jgi:uncharacterized delta-60 repeat protein
LGQSVTFSVVADGTEGLSYQWWKDGNALPQANDASLTLTNLQWADAGYYSVVVSNRYGSVASPPARLKVSVPVMLDAEFNPGADRSVWSMAVQPDGRILLGGTFTALAGQPRKYIARLHADGTLDRDFDPGADGGVGGGVGALAVQSDGKIVVGGSFTSLAGQTRSCLARLNPNGTRDSGFDPWIGSVGSSVTSLALQSDGSIVIGGTFEYVLGQPRSCIARVLPDGTVDAGFNPGADAEVSALALQPDGKIVVGGSFTTLWGQTRSRIARLQTNGTLDSTFKPVANGSVVSLALQADGKILVGGSFTRIADQTRNRIARLGPDGALDSDFNPGASGTVSALAVQADGGILVGGSFTNVAGQTRNRIARLESNGTLDSDFNPGASGTVSALTLQADGRVLVGGSFTNVLGQSCTGIARLNATHPATQNLTREGTTITWPRGGTSPEVWRVLFESSPDGLTWSNLGSGVRLPDSSLGAAGAWQIDGIALPMSASIRARGYVAGADGASGWYVQAMTGAPGFVGLTADRSAELGSTATLSAVIDGSQPLHYQWIKDGQALPQAEGPSLTLPNLQWADAGYYSVVVSNLYGNVTSPGAWFKVIIPVTLDRGFDPGAGGDVFSLAVQPDGKVLVGGAFDIARLNADGSLDPDFNPGARVESLAIQSDGRIVMGGSFLNVAGQKRSRIARLYFDGTLDPDYNPGLSGPSQTPTVQALAVQADGMILVGGAFTGIGDQTRNRIARLHTDGTLDPDFNPAASSDVMALAVQADGMILVGGAFGRLGNQARSKIARLHTDGTLDPDFNPGAYGGDVLSLAVQADGMILVGGNFTSLAGQTRNQIARLRPDGTLDSGFDPGADGSVHSVAVQADGGILVGGRFTTVAGQKRNCIARLNADGTLDPDFNPVADRVGGAVVRALAVQGDGRVLVGGNFTRIVGQSCSGIARLHNTDPATQSLTHEGATITWLRGGTCPEVTRTLFEYSTDGVTWSDLGPGVRIPGRFPGPALGWQIGEVSLPIGASIRARGNVAGSDAGSGWLAQATIGAPAFGALPSDRTVPAGSTSTFTVLAGGSEPLRFQWFKDGVALLDGDGVTGATTAGLRLSRVLKRSEARYHVVVSNAEGSAASQPATLTVEDPAIAVQPSSQNREPGQSALFSVVVAGTEVLNYQWWKDDRPLSQATAASLELVGLQWADAGAYRVVVSNAFGSVTSQVARLDVRVPATLDGMFDPGPDSGVITLAVQADGKILLGGSFTAVCGQPRQRMARLEPDGALDASFQPEAVASDFAYVNCLALQTDGRILAGGGCTPIGGQTPGRIAQLYPDGVLDPTFDLRADGPVSCIAVQADGAILVGGYFTELGGKTRNRLARLLPDGALDDDFNPEADGGVSTLALQADGKILVGGEFMAVDGAARRRIARLRPDGTLDPEFDPGANGYVSCIAVQADGGILVGGSFTDLAGMYRARIARLSADGILDSGFSAWSGNDVLSLAVQADGKILVGGGYSYSAGTRWISRFNPDGTPDNAFAPWTDHWITSFAVQADGRILAGGSFTMFSGEPRSHLVRLNNTHPATQTLTVAGSTITWLRGGTSPEVTRTTFEQSVDGLEWTLLGSGSRTPGGWQLSDIPVSPRGAIRARGHVSGDSSSAWFVETVCTSDSVLTVQGVEGAVHTYSLLGQPGSRYAVQTSTELNAPLAWEPVFYLRLTNSIQSFQWTNTGEPARWFRVQVQPSPNTRALEFGN